MPESSLSWVTFRSTVLPALVTLMPFALRRQPSALKAAAFPETTMPVEPAVTRMPVPWLLCTLLPLTTDVRDPWILMPYAVWPETGCPAPITLFREIVMPVLFETYTPSYLVPLNVSPETVMSARDEITAPKLAGAITGCRPGQAVMVIRADDVPETAGLIVSA